MPDRRDGTQFMLRRPTAIHVQPFDTSSGIWEGDTAAADRRKQISDWLAAKLEFNLNEIAPASLAGPQLPSSGWLVTGRFLRVNPGSKMQRLVLGGLGAGGSKLETKVTVYDLAVSSTEPLVSFSTTGGSNLQTGLQELVTNAIEDDIDRTSREITDFLLERLLPGPAVAPAPAAPGSFDEIQVAPPASRPSQAREPLRRR